MSIGEGGDGGPRSGGSGRSFLNEKKAMNVNAAPPQAVLSPDVVQTPPHGGYGRGISDPAATRQSHIDKFLGENRK